MLDRLETPLDIKSVSDTGRIEGYGSVFGNVDLGGDIVAAGAFAESLAEKQAAGDTIPMLWQHSSDQPIGLWDTFSEDERGLKLSGTVLTDTALGRDAYTFLKHKAVQGLSIGFRMQDSSRDETSGVRTIRRADLWEVSVVTFPMNPEARVDGVKFQDAVRDMSRNEIERFLKRSRRDGAASARDIEAAVARVFDLGAAAAAADAEEAAQLKAAADDLLRRAKGKIT